MRLQTLIVALSILLPNMPASGATEPPGPVTNASGASNQASGNTIKQAQALFNQGRAAYLKGQKEEALRLFQESHGLVPRPSTLINVSVCEEELGRIKSALEHSREVARQLPSGSALLPDVISRITALEARVPRLRVALASGVPVTAEVRLDGSALTSDALRGEVLLDPGEHTLTVDVPGRPQRSFKVKLAEGENTTKSIEAAPEPPPPQKPPEVQTPDTSGMSGRRVAGLVLGGVGALGLGLGAVAGVMAIDKKKQVDGICPPVPMKCASDGVASEDDAWTLAMMSTIAFIAGGVLATTGVTLTALSGHNGPVKVTAVLKVSVTSSAVGLAATGTF